MNRLARCCAMTLCLVFCQQLYAQDIPRTLYVLNGLSRTLSKMDLETGVLVNDILVVGDVPSGLVADANQVYVVNTLPPEIVVIDGRTDAVLRHIPLAEGSNPWDMALTNERRAYVTNLMGNSVSEVDIESGAVTADIAVGEGPQGILIADSSAYVANTGGWPDYSPSTVSVIDIASGQVLRTLSVGTNPQDLARAPDGRIHVVCSGRWGENSGRIYVIDPGDGASVVVADSLMLGGFPGDIVITSDGIGYVTDWGDAEGGFLYSYHSGSGWIYHDWSDPIRVGRGAMKLLWDETGDCLYVSNFDDDTVQRLDPRDGSVKRTFEFGDGAQDMAILDRSDVPFKGDVNLDADIDITDVVSLIRFVLDESEPTPEQFARADCNGSQCQGDQDLNIFDVLTVVNMILSLVDCSQI